MNAKEFEKNCLYTPSVPGEEWDRDLAFRFAEDYASHVTAAQPKLRAGMTEEAHKRVRKTVNVLCDCSDGWKDRAEKAEELVASLTKERAELKQMIVIVAAEGDAQLTETGKVVEKWREAESRVEELEKALREIHQSVISPAKDGTYKGFLVGSTLVEVGGIARKALKGESLP